MTQPKITNPKRTTVNGASVNFSADSAPLLAALLLFLILILSGCPWFEDNRVRTKPQLDTTSPEYQKMLSILINRRYESDYLKCLVADEEYQKYLQEKSESDQGKSIRKDDCALERRH